MHYVMTQHLGQSQQFHLISPGKNCTSISPHSRGRGHTGHAEASSTLRKSDNPARYASHMSLGDTDTEMTHADTLPPGEAVQCIFNDQTHNRDWAPLSQCAFDLPGTSISVSRHRSNDNAVMITTQSAVQMTAWHRVTRTPRMTL